VCAPKLGFGGDAEQTTLDFYFCLFVCLFACISGDAGKMEEEETGGMQQQQQGILEEIHSQRRQEGRSLHPTIGLLQYPTTGFFFEYAQQQESLNTEQQQQQQQQQEKEEEEEEELSLLERKREKKRICNCGRRRTTTFQGAQAAVRQSAGWSESRGPPRISLSVVVVSVSRRSRGRLVSYMTISS
jgi:hypothetical protein